MPGLQVASRLRHNEPAAGVRCICSIASNVVRGRRCERVATHTTAQSIAGAGCTARTGGAAACGTFASPSEEEVNAAQPWCGFAGGAAAAAVARGCHATLHKPSNHE